MKIYAILFFLMFPAFHCFADQENSDESNANGKGHNGEESFKECRSIGRPFMRSRADCYGQLPSWELNGHIAITSGNGRAPSSGIYGDLELLRNNKSNYIVAYGKLIRGSRTSAIDELGLPVAEISNETQFEGQLTDVSSFNTAASMNILELAKIQWAWVLPTFDAGLNFVYRSEDDFLVNIDRSVSLFAAYEKKFRTSDALKFELFTGARELNIGLERESTIEAGVGATITYGAHVGKSTLLNIEAAIDHSDIATRTQLSFELSFWFSKYTAIAISSETWSYSPDRLRIGSGSIATPSYTLLSLVFRR